MGFQTSGAVKELKLICSQFNDTSAQTKVDLLKTCSKKNSFTVKQAQEYQHTLLFLLSYPENETLYCLAKEEIKRFYTLIKKLPRSKKNVFELSGLPSTKTHGIYSFSLVKWLLHKHSGRIGLYSIEPDGIHPKEIFKSSFPEMEFDLLGNDHLSALVWLEKAFGTKKKTELLNRLVHHLDQLTISEHGKEQHFESLKIYIGYEDPSGEFARAHLHLPSNPLYFHTNGLLKKFDETEIVNRKLPAVKQLSQEEKKQLISVSRATLFLLSRETDPVTSCNENGIEVYDLEHGLCIALFSMLPERRLPLESYIGFMMYKNGYPMAYGGAWLFGVRSLLGINIFESFRGGESAFVFSQLLRTYKQRFKAAYFEVEPYQFGKNNPEGLKSGAFWFYYRFGFRPVETHLKNLAEQEANKIQKEKNYRTPISVLKEFTECNLALKFNPKAIPLDASSISIFITQQIIELFSGDRKAARNWCLSKLKKDLGIDLKFLSREEKCGVEKLCAFVALCLKTEHLNNKEKQHIRDFIFEKGRSEFDYTEHCCRINFLELISSPSLKAELTELSKKIT